MNIKTKQDLVDNGFELQADDGRNEYWFNSKTNESLNRFVDEDGDEFIDDDVDGWENQ